MSTTNYTDTFIEVAEDCPAMLAEIPPAKGEAKTVAALQYEIVKNNPYRYTSDDVLFSIYALRNGITKKDYEREREKFFSKGQACFRSSPLPKRYGWGVHNDADGKIAIYRVESDDYRSFVKDKSLKHVKAMRSKRR